MAWKHLRISPLQLTGFSITLIGSYEGVIMTALPPFLTGITYNPSGVPEHYAIFMRELGIDPEAPDADQQYFSLRAQHIGSDADS